MRYRLRTLLPGQFGLLALFTWTTLVAVALAIIRLPIFGAAKFLILTVLWSLFRIWNHAKQPQTPAARIHAALLDVVGGMICPVYFLSNVVTSNYGQPTGSYVTVTSRGLLVFTVAMRATHWHGDYSGNPQNSLGTTAHCKSPSGNRHLTTHASLQTPRAADRRGN